MALKSMAYPNRLFDLSLIFRGSFNDLSQIIGFVLNHIMNKYGFLLTDLNQPWLSNSKLKAYSEAVFPKGPPLSNCWGFIIHGS